MTPEQLALSEAIALAGGQSELARKLTASSGRLVKQQHVWNWLNREKRPPAKLSIFI
ncbi:YdaS family helix-turn-helix protein, partial [Escherichia coli]